MSSNNSSSSRVAHNYEVFEMLLDMTEDYINDRQFAAAAASSQIAASHAFVDHCGIFASPGLEGMLEEIGLNSIQVPRNLARRIPVTCDPKHLLHVLNSGRPTGGDTRYVWRWIREDSNRTHSVALIRQRNIEVPKHLSDEISRSGGNLYILDKEASTVISQAQELRRVSAFADMIVLHIFPDDVVPLIAFADRSGLPPIVFINHSDHTFWLGAGISDSVAHLRECGVALSEVRRGIAKAKMTFLPTPLSPVARNLSAVQAKLKLGYSSDTVILLTIATAFKYMPIEKICLNDLLAPSLRKFEKVVLLAIGPDKRELCKAGFDISDSRVVALGRCSDTAIFYEAADIYIDSFPFSSITSLLEAGSYSLPVVTFCSYQEDAKVLSAGAPGLSGTMFQCTTVENYNHTLDRLINDENLRRSAGEKTMKQIAEFHTGAGWKNLLSELYIKTSNLAQADPVKQSSADKLFEKIDEHLCDIYYVPSHVEVCIDNYAQSLPYMMRVKFLLKLLKINRLFSFSMFLPKWLEKRISGHFNFWRQLPGINKLLSIQPDLQSRV